MDEIFVLTDCAGAHYWTGEYFIPVKRWDPREDAIPFFETEAAAWREVAHHRRAWRGLIRVERLMLIRPMPRPSWPAEFSRS